MRTAFIETLCELAGQDERIWLLTGDLGYSVLERYAMRFPERYVNVGVAEQNMTGIAAGLALSGKIVFTYSIANFPVLRCLEQIRNDICYHNLNVKVVAVGGGLAYGPQGYTHHGLEDLAVMRALPNMTVIAPGDPVETGLATSAIADRSGPCYLRLSKAGEPTIHTGIPSFAIGKAITVCNGTDLTLIATGGMLKTAVETGLEMEKRGYSARVLSMHTLKPLDVAAVFQAAKETGRIATIEEHSSGGLGTAVAEVLAGANQAVQFTSFAISMPVFSVTGSQSYLRGQAGLTVDQITESLIQKFFVKSQG